MTRVQELFSVGAWLTTPKERQGEILAALGERLGLQPLGIRTHGAGTTPIGSLRHEASGVVFRLIPGGKFLMGISDGELRALEAILAKGREHGKARRAAEDSGEPLPHFPGHYVDVHILDSFLHRDDGDLSWHQPAHEVNVPPFLIASHPLTAGEARTWLPGYPALHYLGRHDLGPNHVGGLDRPHLLELLRRWPFRLPTEAEWEYAVRAGTTTLCHRGNDLLDLPDEDDLLDDFADESVNERDENAYGLHGIGAVSEVCADVYVDGYQDAPCDGSARLGVGAWAVRSGMLRPSQGINEWMSLLSAARNGDACGGSVRPAVSLPPIGD